MGNCLRGNAEEDVDLSQRSLRSTRAQVLRQRSANSRHQQPQQPLVAKNFPLRRERIRWNSEQPLTDSQLRSKRDEFWDTAPAFEGRKEIWDALKAAAAALESGDHELAQAIVSGAGVTLPHGLLTDCYDELGSRYQLPLYVLAAPVNLISSPAAAGAAALDGSADASCPDADGDSATSDSAPRQQQVLLNLRLSDGRELSLPVQPDDTIQRAKRLLERRTGCSADGQRWFCYGNLLADRIRVRDCTIPRGFVVQVIVRQSSAPPPVTD
ncbi:hypothetical protein BOX15_Mlig034324g3 [Macrostomum lignano]|uniref:Ubiquitin-like domain-containing protein n=1 Tax=Macrostomum lignano TaxID=282301 RepID=A0A267H5V5_9PLAT|nr:hypothetical protein BOX15_Mlig034324g3 [Macrostomum lignano]